MRAFAFGYCPKGWAEAQGQLQQIHMHPEVYALMGATYGGDGVSAFALPDLLGRTPLGVGVDAQDNRYPFGQAGGREAVTLTIDQMPAHTHDHLATTVPATRATPAAGALLARMQNAGLYVDAAADTALTTALSGGGQPLSTRDPYLAVTWCVALAGTFPQPED